ncbi:MAG: response regulator with CheY-like receiver, AAA-type ATPase, and DNA-binding domain [Holophagaceae bacterium]|nr:response regulator with CheY-like receiver, AAA-type ATPase, and DNA-binding domain [Holophagaceae bacterium]
MRQQLEDLVAEMVRKEIPLEMAVREFERAYLLQVLEAHDGNQSAAAKRLGIHRNTLSKKLEPRLASLRYPAARVC